jgi:hypothetical protein
MPVGDPRSIFMSEGPPTIQFDKTRAMRYFPKQRLMLARIVEKPAEAVTVVEDKLFGPETFYGSYVIAHEPATNTEIGTFGYREFMRLHTPVEGVENGWYYSDPVDAYQADTEVELLVARVRGTQHVHVGDWILRHSDYTVRCISDEDFTSLYDLELARPIPLKPE